MRVQPKGAPGECNCLDENRSWDELRSRLPADLDERARQSGALRRARKVRNGEQLLRLILIYATCTLSMRDSAAWAGRALHLSLTADALNYRFSCAVRFLRTLVLDEVRRQMGRQDRPGPALRILDGTGLNEPGSKGTDWRLHVTYTPGEGAVGLELTDAHGGEHLTRGVGQPGDVFLIDRGYGHAREVRTARAEGKEIVVRVHLQNLPVQDIQGQQLAPKTLLKRADKGVLDQPVRLTEAKQEPVEARLVIAPLPREKAARARQKVRKAAAKKGRSPDALALKLAGYFCVVTTLDAERLPAKTLLTWYKIRWQVELWFKRSKSLLRLGQLTKASVLLVSIQIWGRLLVALLIQRLWPHPPDVEPVPGKPPLSAWRLTRIYWLDVVLAVYGGTSLDRRLADKQSLEHLREHSRRKRTWADTLIADAKRTLGSWQPSKADA